MFSIQKATEKDCYTIAGIGRVSVAESHKGSSSDEIMNDYLEKHYSFEAIKNELCNINHIYYILNYKNQAAGFSKIVLNAAHPNIDEKNVALLDKIYFLKEFHGYKLGLELLKYNLELAKENLQSGIWLYVWAENKKAIDFYHKAGFKIIGTYDFLVAQSHYNLSYQMLLNFNK